MSCENFDKLLDLITPHIRRFAWREPIPPGERLALTLRYLASGNSMISLSYAFLIGASTVSAVIRDTCSAIWRVLGPRVFEPISQEMWLSVAHDYDRLWQYPNCIGALDGKHCVVQKFARAGSLFYNYKGTHSIVLLALCDAKYRRRMWSTWRAGLREELPCGLRPRCLRDGGPADSCWPPTEAFRAPASAGAAAEGEAAVPGEVRKVQ